ncbi:hypothetical protein M3Y94_00147600 [Aphelenchoides besseyi]|nr:hypothetical protein M3Y94_00147600 [Aphelenchoides besseyi]
MHQRAVGQAGRKGVVQMHFLSIEQLKMVLPLHCPPTGPGEMAGSIEECEETALESLSEHFKVKHLSECPNKDLLKYPIPGLIYGIGKRLVVPLRVRAHRKSLADPESTDLIVYFIVDSGSPMTSFAPKTAEKLFGERALGSAIIQDRNVYCGSSEDFSAAMKNVNLLGSYFLRQLQTSIIVSPHPHDYLPDARVFYLTPISKISRAQKNGCISSTICGFGQEIGRSCGQQTLQLRCIWKSTESGRKSISSVGKKIPGLIHGMNSRLVVPLRVRAHPESKDLIVYFIVDSGTPMTSFGEKTAEKLFGGKNFDTAIIQELIYQQCHVKWNFFSVGNAKIHRGRLAVFQNNHNKPKGRAPKVHGKLEDEVAEECEFGEEQFVREGFAVSCVSNELLGCVDEFGDLVREGLYVTAKGALRFCYVYQNKRRARIERQGCFNGTRDDDPNDKRFHFSKGQIWHTKEYDFRCGDDGFQVYKCKPSAKELVHTGVAWFNC